MVEQLLPPPLRYRLVWHAKGSGASSAGGDEKRPPLYLWRAVPPGPQFCALGVLATATEVSMNPNPNPTPDPHPSPSPNPNPNQEPPPISAVHCVPRRWCGLEKQPPRLVWSNEGQGGMAGAIWTNASQLQTMMAAQGHEPPAQVAARP